MSGLAQNTCQNSCVVHSLSGHKEAIGKFKTQLKPDHSLISFNHYTSIEHLGDTCYTILGKFKTVTTLAYLL